MNVTPPLAAAFHFGGTVESRIALPDSREFSSRLTIGQILKGRVLLHYEDNRYRVAFDGQERTVDSSVPLRAGDLLRGRVIALGDRVELQYLPDERGGDVSFPGNGEAAELSGQAPELPSDVDALFVRYQAKLSADGRDALLRMMKSAPDPGFVAIAGLTLAKLGLSQNPQILQAVTAALARTPANEMAGPRDYARNPTLGPGLALQLRELVRQAVSEPENLSEDFSSGPHRSSLTSDSPVAETTAKNANTDSPDSRSGRLGGSVLNTQGGGSVGHRIGTLPLIVGNRLIEVDIAVFDHEREKSTQTGTHHRALVFVLNLDKLGRVEVSAAVVENRLRIRIGADRDEAMFRFSLHAESLQEALTQAGWSVDEVTYQSGSGDRSNPVVRSVVEHVIVQDSVNRLV